MSQEPTSRPSSRPATSKIPGVRPEQKRDGGFFGLRFVEIKKDGKSALYLTGVFEGSDAARLGFEKGDTLLGIDGARFDNADRFLMGFYQQTARMDRRRGGFVSDGKKHHMDVLRNGKPLEVAFSILELDKNPRPGSPAPDLVLKAADGKTKVQLSKLWSEKPLFLVFGSFT